LTCQGVCKPKAMLNKVSLFIILLYSATHYKSYRAKKIKYLREIITFLRETGKIEPNPMKHKGIAVLKAL